MFLNSRQNPINLKPAGALDTAHTKATHSGGWGFSGSLLGGLAQRSGKGKGLQEAQYHSHRKGVTWTPHGDAEKTGRDWSPPGDPVRPHRPETDSKSMLVCALKTHVLVPQEGKAPAAPATKLGLAWAETSGAVSSRAGVQKCRRGI